MSRDTLHHKQVVVNRLNFKAFPQQDTVSPEGPETSTISATQQDRCETRSVSKPRYSSLSSGQKLSKPEIRLHRPDKLYLRASRLRMLKEAEAELSSLLPQLEVVTLFVDDYFDRIHSSYWYPIRVSLELCSNRCITTSIAGIWRSRPASDLLVCSSLCALSVCRIRAASRGTS